MNIKKIYKVMISKPIIIILFLLLFLYALMCLDLGNQTTSAAGFLNKFNQQLNALFFQVPLILILIVTSFRKLYNEMIIIRFNSEMNLLKAEIIAATLIAIVYIFLMVFIEMVFVFLISGIPKLCLIFSFIISICIQTLTVFFVAVLYIMLNKISRNSNIAIMIMLFILGIDAYTTIVRTPFFPESFNVFISPMCCFSEYIIYPEDMNYYFYFPLSVMKIAIVILITCLSIWITRRDYLAQK